MNQLQTNSTNIYPITNLSNIVDSNNESANFIKATEINNYINTIQNNIYLTNLNFEDIPLSRLTTGTMSYRAPTNYTATGNINVPNQLNIAANSRNFATQQITDKICPYYVSDTNVYNGNAFGGYFLAFFKGNISSITSDTTIISQIRHMRDDAQLIGLNTYTVITSKQTQGSFLTILTGLWIPGDYLQFGIQTSTNTGSLAHLQAIIINFPNYVNRFPISSNT